MLIVRSPDRVESLACVGASGQKSCMWRCLLGRQSHLISLGQQSAGRARARRARTRSISGLFAVVIAYRQKPRAALAACWRILSCAVVAVVRLQRCTSLLLWFNMICTKYHNIIDYKYREQVHRLGKIAVACRIQLSTLYAPGSCDAATRSCFRPCASCNAAKQLYVHMVV